MKPEDKQIVFQDLCARLPYHVRCKIWLKYGTTEEGPLDLEHNYGDVLQDAFFYHDRIKDIKPYLRRMSSMTKEEEKEYSFLLDNCGWGINEDLKIECLDWLNAHHFDYRELISDGLAIEVTENINPYKED